MHNESTWLYRLNKDNFTPAPSNVDYGDWRPKGMKRSTKPQLYDLLGPKPNPVETAKLQAAVARAHLVASANEAEDKLAPRK